MVTKSLLVVYFGISLVICQTPAPTLPTFLDDTSTCKINACEALKMVTDFFGSSSKYKSKPTPPSSTPSQKTPSDDEISPNKQKKKISFLGELDTYTMEYDLQKRVRQIESRLRSVEQPVWRLTSSNQEEWNHCTSGVCRCNPDTKRFTCWNVNLKSVPVTQIIPMDMVYMYVLRFLGIYSLPFICEVESVCFEANFEIKSLDIKLLPSMSSFFQ